MLLDQHPPFTSGLFAIKTGAAGIQQTLCAMAALADAAKTDLLIRHTALDIIRAWPEKDRIAEAEALQSWVRDNIRYTGDVTGVETVQAPSVTLAVQCGDCDDKSTLLAALLLSVGHTPRLVALGSAPGEFSHVMVEDVLMGAAFALETTESVNAGWYPSDMPYRMEQAL